MCACVCACGKSEYVFIVKWCMYAGVLVHVCVCVCMCSVTAASMHWCVETADLVYS